jgi:hypothetical protein
LQGYVRVDVESLEGRPTAKGITAAATYLGTDTKRIAERLERMGAVGLAETEQIACPEKLLLRAIKRRLFGPRTPKVPNEE